MVFCKDNDRTKMVFCKDAIVLLAMLAPESPLNPNHAAVATATMRK